MIKRLIANGAAVDLNTAVCLGNTTKALELVETDGRDSAPFKNALLHDLGGAITGAILKEVDPFEPDMEILSRVEERFLPLLERLLAEGLDPNATEFGSWPPLMSLVQAGALRSVRMLLSSGSDPNYRSETGTDAGTLSRNSPVPEAMSELLRSFGYSAS